MGYPHCATCNPIATCSWPRHWCCRGRWPTMSPTTSPTNAGSGCVDIGPERKHLLMDGHSHQAFDLSKARNQRHAERRERGTAAALAAFPWLNGCAFADTIDLEDPRVPVGHIHRP